MCSLSMIDKLWATGHPTNHIHGWSYKYSCTAVEGQHNLAPRNFNRKEREKERSSILTRSISISFTNVRTGLFGSNNFFIKITI